MWALEGFGSELIGLLWVFVGFEVLGIFDVFYN